MSLRVQGRDVDAKPALILRHCWPANARLEYAPIIELSLNLNTAMIIADEERNGRMVEFAKNR